MIQRLIFGELVRQYREERGIEFSEAEQRLGGYGGKLSKVEGGTIGPDRNYVESMIEFYKLDHWDADELRDLAIKARRRSSPKGVPSSSRRYVALERVAAEIRMVYNEIPGLLQSTEFAHCMLARSPVLPSSDSYAQAEARQHRGDAVLREGGSDVRVVLGVEALYREVGGPEVLARQLERLLELIELPNVQIRIVPWSAGVVPGLGCPFTLLYIKPARKIAYVASLIRPDYIKATDAFTVAFNQAWELASSDDDSAEILKARIAELS